MSCTCFWSYDFLPVSALTDGGLIKFLKVKRIWIRTTYFTFQNKTITGTSIPDTHLSTNTIFSQCDMILGDRLISQSSATNLYRALIEMLPNFF